MELRSNQGSNECKVVTIETVMRVGGAEACNPSFIKEMITVAKKIKTNNNYTQSEHKREEWSSVH